jgi:drug/metabolite transporter (DMT)-like permease
MKNKQILGIIGILLATLFWGMTFAFIRQAVSSLSPANFLFWRFGIAGLLLFIFGHKLIRNQAKEAFFGGTFLGLFLAGTVLFQTMGLQTIPASTASFITGFSVILVPIFSSVLTKKLPPIRVFIAAVMALIGIGTISLSSGFSVSSGDLWILLCAICFASYIVSAGKYSRSTIHPIALTSMQCMTVFFISGIVALATSTLSIPNTQEEWISILFCALFASIFAFLLQLYFQKYISSTTTAIIFSCEPIFATITAVILLGEKLNNHFYIGAALIFIAILISELKLKIKKIPQD